MSVYIVNGAPGSGKTTFENYVKKMMGDFYCKNISTIDFVKDIAKKSGWDGEKTPESRKFLSDLKQLLADFNDIPNKQICRIVKEYTWDYSSWSIDWNSWAIFVDCREPAEIARLCKQLDAKSILIRRADAEEAKPSNKSDAGVLNYNYDIVIDNNSSLRDLAITALNFIKKEGLHMSSKPLQIDFFGQIHFIG